MIHKSRYTTKRGSERKRREREGNRKFLKSHGPKNLLKFTETQKFFPATPNQVTMADEIHQKHNTTLHAYTTTTTFQRSFIFRFKFNKPIFISSSFNEVFLSNNFLQINVLCTCFIKV